MEPKSSLDFSEGEDVLDTNEPREMGGALGRSAKVDIADFVTLFAYFWHQDFPLDRHCRTWGKRSDWTIHIGIVLRKTADLLGYFSHFEDGQRTDMVVRDREGYALAWCEWEWLCPQERGFNEIEKFKKSLAEAEKATEISKQMPEFCFLYSYACIEDISGQTHDENQVLQVLQDAWGQAAVPLVIGLMLFKQERQGRKFKRMVFYRIESNRRQVLRTQAAVPWRVPHTRWFVAPD